MKLSRKFIILIAVALIAASGSYIYGRTGTSVSKAVVESRCTAGAFVHHSDNTRLVADDDNEDGTVAPGSVKPVQLPVGGGEAKATGDNLIPNPTIESLTGTAPNGWLANIYGQNEATFSIAPGRNSPTALRTQMTKYSGGDADWYYSAVNVKPGQYYRYVDYYRSDVTTQATLTLKDTTGNSTYITLTRAEAAANWTRYEATFFVPQNVTQAMVFHSIAKKGFLETDDFSLTAVDHQGFDRPLVSVTFDDGWRSVYTTAMPLMERYNVVSTQYLITGYLGQAKDYLTPAQVYDLRKAGHEIASHTVDHADLTKQNAEAMRYQIERSRQDLGKCFGTPATQTFAAPYGTYNSATTALVEKNYQTARSTDAGYNTADNFKTHSLLVQNVEYDTKPEQIKSWLEVAKRNHVWLILVYHQIDDSSTYARNAADFERDLQAIKASGIATKTMSQAYAELKPQVDAVKR